MENLLSTNFTEQWLDYIASERAINSSIVCTGLISVGGALVLPFVALTDAFLHAILTVITAVTGIFIALPKAIMECCGEKIHPLAENFTLLASLGYAKITIISLAAMTFGTVLMLTPNGPEETYNLFFGDMRDIASQKKSVAKEKEVLNKKEKVLNQKEASLGKKEADLVGERRDLNAEKLQWDKKRSSLEDTFSEVIEAASKGNLNCTDAVKALLSNYTEKNQEQWEKLEKEYTQEKAELESDYKDKCSRYEERFNAELKELKEAHAEEQQSLRMQLQDLTGQYTERRQELSDQIETMEKDFKKEQTTLQAHHGLEQQELIEKHNQEITESQRKSSDQMGEMAKVFETNQTSLQAYHRLEQKELIEKYEQKIKELQSEGKKTEAALKSAEADRDYYLEDAASIRKEFNELKEEQKRLQEEAKL